MKETSNKIVKRLKYVNDTGLGLKWTNFLKNCNVNFYNSRKDRLWYSIRGKGYIIWISSQYPQRQDNKTYWLVDLEISKNAPQEGKDCLNELIEVAIKTFDNMELIVD